jgi:biopolymer transport protein ExbD
MSKFDVPEALKQKPVIQLAPLVDIAFWALIFYMVIAVLSQMESEVDIKVPKSRVATVSTASAGKIVINITRQGKFIVNDQQVDAEGLEAILKKVSKLFPNQQVLVRADELTYHKFVIQALDACMRSNIWDVSFSTVHEEGKE